ncbi:MAG: hypothetical protein ABIJ57_14430 [Pseudomonadota bacterium]
MTEATVEGAKETTVVTPAVTADALTSPLNDGFSRIDPSVDNVSDIDGIPAKEGETKTAEDLAKDAEAKTAADKVAADKTAQEELTRFDKHPRFKEMESKITDLTAKLTAKEAVAPVEKDLPYKDITKMEKEKLLEWQEDDPVGYAANLYQQMLYEARQTFKQEQAEAHQTTSIKGTYEAYEKENSDFRPKWDSGEIQKFMNDHPGHNAMSAHAAITGQTIQARIDAAVKEAVTKAVKETEERVTKNFQAKRNAEVIGDGGSIKAEGIPDELKNPEKYGGATQALATRLSRMRQAAAGG